MGWPGILVRRPAHWHLRLHSALVSVDGDVKATAVFVVGDDTPLGQSGIVSDDFNDAALEAAQVREACLQRILGHREAIIPSTAEEIDAWIEERPEVTDRSDA